MRRPPRQKLMIDTGKNIQPFDYYPKEKPVNWMFYPASYASDVSAPGVRGKLPRLFGLGVRKLNGDGIIIEYAYIAYSKGWWCVGKEPKEERYNIYFTPMGVIVFNGSLGECYRRLLLLPEYPIGFPLDPPLTLEEWNATREMVKQSPQWQEIEEILLRPKEIDAEQLLKLAQE